MAMDVSRDEPLTPEARQYLADRNQHDLIAQIDGKYPPKETSPVVSQAAGNDTWTPATGLEQLSNADLMAELRRRQAAGEDFSDVEDDDESDDDYDAWTNAELDAELAERTDADGNALSKSGAKADKVKRLRENDAWLASQG